MRGLTTFMLTGQLALMVLPANGAQGNDDDSPVKNSRPNIILVMTDDQGYGDFGSNDNPFVKTPVIDQLATESIRFTHFHVDPTCSPTRAALMSGQYSLRAGVWHTVMGRHMLSAQHYTLPEALKDAGYKTAMVGKWHLGDNYPFRPQDQGFDHVLMHGAGGVGQAPDYWGNTQFDDTYFLNGTPKKYDGYATDIWFDEAIDFIHDNANKPVPFFLYLATNAPHAPFRAPEKYVEPYREMGLPEALALFYGMIASIDENMGRLRAAMHDERITDNTIFVFMTDNGSVMGVQGTKLIAAEANAAISEKFETLNYYMRGAKNSAYEGGHRVPFYISWPDGDLAEPGEVDGLSAHFDVMPTLLDLVGIDIDKLDTDGISLKGAIKDGTTLPDRALTVTTQRVLNPDPNRPYSVMQGKWRYVHAQGKGTSVELFDIEADPGQTNDVIDQHPEIARQMATEYQKWWEHTTGEGFKTTRSIVGTSNENPTRLTSHDWLAPTTTKVGHTPGFGSDQWAKRGWLGKEDTYAISPWKVRAGEEGNYLFTLYYHDEPANKIIPKKYGYLSLNGKTHVAKLHDGATSVMFEVNLDKGDLDIKAWFDDSEDASDKPLAAFYLYVERLNQ